ncbi:immediate early response gene 2 protein [Thalassophryne amazonica]|uniref:immediate early response gene 2 protein n=1 Tax=Thalassophryne amazonica TaxID=390379 RepID=UPI0014723DCB|nr:immediate early response gene 2 protein [Thalassophryne amazonica]
MEVSAEAKRIMVLALGKLYSSRTQRGGVRLHRSLLLTVVMKSARDIYHAAQSQTSPRGACVVLPERLTDTDTDGRDKENSFPSDPARHSRKRRGKAAAEPDFLPRKKAKLERLSGVQRLAVSSLFLMNCGSELAAPQHPELVQRTVTAC